MCLNLNSVCWLNNSHFKTWRVILFTNPDVFCAQQKYGFGDVTCGFDSKTCFFFLFVCFFFLLIVRSVTSLTSFVARLQRVRLMLPPVGLNLRWPMKTAVARQPSPYAAPPPAEPLWPPGCVWACSVGWWRPAADRSTSGGCWGKTETRKVTF